jgi:hypothetical protein
LDGVGRRGEFARDCKSALWSRLNTKILAIGSAGGLDRDSASFDYNAQALFSDSPGVPMKCILYELGKLVFVRPVKNHLPDIEAHSLTSYTLTYLLMSQEVEAVEDVGEVAAGGWQ